MNSTRDANQGLVLGLIAATGYSITNLALRKLATGDGGLAWDIFVSGTKALPTFVAAVILLGFRISRGQKAMPSAKLVGALAATAVVMQFGGNVGFQLALRAIGLAITVPIVFSSIIVSGALLGRVALGDPVSPRTAFSMALMVVSIAFLSMAAQTAHASMANVTSVGEIVVQTDTASDPVASDEVTPGIGGSASERHSERLLDRLQKRIVAGGVVFGVLIALISGLSYGVCGVVIRRVVRGTLPVESTLLIFSTVGLLTLWPISSQQLGVDGIRQIAAADWMYMLIAGIFNAIAFFAISHAMRFLTISRTNVINASQNAMCAVGAVVFFAEPMSLLAVSGIGLTIVGLLTLDRR